MNIFNLIHKDFYNLTFSSNHKNIIELLQQPLSNNILLYGSNELPHNIIIDSAMFLKYGSFKKQQYTWEKELIYIENPYYIEIDFAHIGQPKNIDIIVNFLKNIITHKSLSSDKKLIVLYNIEIVCIKNKSYSFRNILEKFSYNNIFICSTYCFSSIENPIKSRFISFRIPILSSDNIRSILNYYNIYNNIAEPFINNSNLFLSIKYSELPDIVNNNNIPYDLNYYYPPILDIVKNPTAEKIRNISHKLCIHNIPIYHIVLDFIKINPNNTEHFIHIGTYIDHLYSLHNSNIRPIYIEYLLHSFIDKINI